MKKEIEFLEQRLATKIDEHKVDKTKEKLKKVFWREIAKAYPELNSGPIKSVQLDMLFDKAIKNWIYNSDTSNLKIKMI